MNEISNRTTLGYLVLQGMYLWDTNYTKEEIAGFSGNILVGSEGVSVREGALLVHNFGVGNDSEVEELLVFTELAMQSALWMGGIIHRDAGT